MSEHAVSTHERRTRQARRAVISSCVGTSVEWYEYFIYGTAAALYFGPLYFPSHDPVVARLIAFASFGVAFLARPLGALLFGHLGDRVGRKSTMIFTLLLMGLATGAIGLVPTYAEIGMLAPITLVSLRLLQGLAVGGEWGGAMLVAIENAPRHKVRLFGAAPQMGSGIGLLMATGAMALVGLLPHDARVAWGWRVPFIVGFVLVIIGLVIRLGVEESEDFARVKAQGRRVKVPIADVLRNAKLPTLVSILMQASFCVLFYMVATYFVSYATYQLKLPQSTTFTLVMIASVVDLVAFPIVCSLGDSLGAPKVFLFGSIFAILAGVPFYLIVNTAVPVYLAIALSVTMVCGQVTTYGMLGTMSAELYPAEYRYTGVAVSGAIASILFSAPTPFVAEWLMHSTGSWHYLAGMISTAGVIATIGCLGYLKLRHRVTPVGYVGTRDAGRDAHDHDHERGAHDHDYAADAAANASRPAL
ncbi:MFS transporter [Pararobbsia silviterrae]|uniref:MFS transporter n=1 Tax=Pararobbsia silviterrae TaxID=1792498 RepID=A0A494Y4T5_9BURK|nr:MFS transporter [Pararobbsia silviterrae]RKP57651.1 MFS transporter [Pararobbsia silviterrae]